MRTLKELLIQAAGAIDAYSVDDCIKVWRFKDAPPELKALSDNGGDEDWLAVVPDDIAGGYYVPWLEGPSFGCAHVLTYPIAGAIVFIGCHA